MATTCRFTLAPAGIGTTIFSPALLIVVRVVSSALILGILGTWLFRHGEVVHGRDLHED